MRPRFKLPMFAVALALLGLIALLATLQYRWLGRISDAERDRMRGTLNTRASGFAQDFDGELARAYLLFQLDPQATENVAMRVAIRYDRWQATARYPRLIRDVYIVGPDVDAGLRRFNPGTHVLEPVVWPPALAPIRADLSARRDTTAPGGGLVMRVIPAPIWERAPALLIPTPTIVFNQHPGPGVMRMSAGMSYTVLLMDRDYITTEMLPALAQQHFRQTDDGFDYQLAVVSTLERAPVYQSSTGFSPKPDDQVDAAVDLLQIRMQDFGSIASEIRRFTSTTITGAPGTTAGRSTMFREQIVLPSATGSLTVRESGPVSIILQNGARNPGGATTATRFTTTISTPHWRLLIKHPSGSLEGAVDTARRRNLIVSSSILAVLGASVALLVLSTRRAQELARQQMEFVAAVSHELRTPLAVIRSAGENLADGVVHDAEQIRKYGDLVRNEGRRLTEMVEQILEFAGIQSGQRGFALRPVALAPMLHEIVDSSRALIDAAGIQIEHAIADRLPPVLADETALRQLFQNLITNAVKYGVQGKWIGIRAGHVGREVHVTISDRGIGIAPGEQQRIFEPFYRAPEVIAAQIQGAGLGLSLVKRIVEAHGGRISVQSVPGSRSEFTVVLPAASEEPIGRTAISDAPGHGSHA